MSLTSCVSFANFLAPLCIVLQLMYISTHENLLYSAHGTIISDIIVCLARDNYYQLTHLFSHTEIIMLIDCLCY